MPEDDIRRIMVALAKIEVAVESVRAENLLGQSEHVDFEARLRELEHEKRVDPVDVEARLRGLERVRWILYGVTTAFGAFGGAFVTEWLGS